MSPDVTRSAQGPEQIALLASTDPAAVLTDVGRVIVEAWALVDAFLSFALATAGLDGKDHSNELATGRRAP